MCVCVCVGGWDKVTRWLELKEGVFHKLGKGEERRRGRKGEIKRGSGRMLASVFWHFELLFEMKIRCLGGLWWVGRPTGD